MIPREQVLGHRIVKILGDSSSSDEDFNFTDFIYVLDNDVTLRMPFDDETGDLLPLATLEPNHHPIDWSEADPDYLQKNLWDAEVDDILVPQDSEARYPDTGIIKLSVGSSIVQFGGAPRGIVPRVSVLEEMNTSDSMISIWQAIENNRPS